MRHWFTLFIIIFLQVNPLYAQKNVKTNSIEINAVEFKNAVWDYTENENDFEYKGKKPAVVCFYSPLSTTNKASISILDELGKESKGKFDVYKVNSEQEKELIRLFQIKECPAYLFITKKGEPQVYVGFKTKEQLAQLIDLTILK